VAVEHDVPLLTLNRDFRRIAAIEPALRLVEVSVK
jgi:predicted nucleic acid-binding protein